MAGRFVSNEEYGAANLVELVLRYREKHEEIDANLLALASKIDEKVLALKQELLGGASAAFDTFKELQDLIANNKEALEALSEIAGKHVRFDIAQALTNAEQARGRSNLGAVGFDELNAAINNAIPKAPTASVYKSGDTATITIRDASGTTTASIADGKTGPFYTPIVDADGNISWTNNGGLANPSSRNIRGPQGVKGDPLTFGDLTAEQIEALRGREGQQGPVGPQGYTFTPSVSSTGVLTWTNNGGLTNPSAVNLKGPQGDQGPQGKAFTYSDFTQSQLDALRGPQGIPGETGSDGKDGVTFTPSLSSSGVLTWTNNGGLANPNAVSLMGPQGPQGKAFTYNDFSAAQLEALRGPSGKDGQSGSDGKNGVTFTPSVSASGDLSWANNGGLTNPQTVNLVGPTGASGSNGKDGSNGATFTPSVSANGDLSWTNDKSLTNPATVNIRGPQGEPGVSPDPSLYLSKEEYAEGFDGGEL